MTIIGIGDFQKLDIRLVHRYAARLSQAFTATQADAVSVKVEELLRIEDISTADNNFIYFTDGVGTLSPTLAREI
jgi:RNA-dependent RNA polymerase